MSTNKANKSFAEEGLEDLTSDANELLSQVPPSSNLIEDEGELQQVGGLEPVSLFYRLTPPKTPPKSPTQVISKGFELKGVYERSFISGKMKKPTFLIRNGEGKLVGIGGAGSLEKSLLKVAEGSRVHIIYDGTEIIKGGDWAGNSAHAFRVFAAKLKSSSAN